MSIFRLKPVAQARRRQLVMHGIRVYNHDGSEVEDPGDAEGITLHVQAVVDLKAERVMEEGEALKPTGSYYLQTEVLALQNITGKDPLLLVNANAGFVHSSKSFYCDSYITKGFEGSVMVQYTPHTSVNVEDIVGKKVARLVITM